MRFDLFLAVFSFCLFCDLKILALTERHSSERGHNSYVTLQSSNIMYIFFSLIQVYNYIVILTAL